MKMFCSTLAAAFVAVGAGSVANAQETPAVCEQAAGQAFIGQTATAQSGAAILKATGARTFQWVFENSPVSMDLRPDRVRVVYNREMKIIAVNCG